MNGMHLTEQQACRLLQVTPATLSVYVATRRLNVTRKRTIRGLVVSYDQREVEALSRELHEDQEYIRTRFGQGKSSRHTVEAELVDFESDSTDAQETNSFVPTSAPVIERLLILLEGLTPSGRPTVALEKKLLLTIGEAAAYSGLSEVKLNKAIRAGELSARKDLGKGHRIKRSDIERYVKSL
jgi:excisionase family DNA binding protein